MSAEMGSNTNKVVRVYVPLLDEGTDVVRPTEAIELGSGVYRILRPSDYDPEDETWEYPPGSLVRCEKRRGDSGDYLCAIEIVPE